MLVLMGSIAAATLKNIHTPNAEHNFILGHRISSVDYVPMKSWPSARKEKHRKLAATSEMSQTNEHCSPVDVTKAHGYDVSIKGPT